MPTLAGTRSFYRINPASLAFGLVLVSLGMLPFAGILEIRHVLANVDRSEHQEHSEFDLCQWVQAHGYGSVDFEAALPVVPLQPGLHSRIPREGQPASVVIHSHTSRGPPLFL